MGNGSAGASGQIETLPMRKQMGQAPSADVQMMENDLGQKGPVKHAVKSQGEVHWWNWCNPM
jgi:hypothetical protein